MKSLGVVIPFLNEEKALRGVVDSLVENLESNNISYHILLVNDGSTDQSGRIGEALCEKNENISIIHKDEPENIGSAFKDGINQLKTDLICWLPSDGEIPANAVYDCYRKSVESDSPSIVYPTNTFEIRSFFRAILSKTFQLLCRIIFNMPVRYFNGIAIYKREEVKKLNLISSGFTINLELIIKYAQTFKVSYEEVPFTLERRVGGEEKALKLVNIVNVMKFLFLLKMSKAAEQV